MSIMLPKILIIWLIIGLIQLIIRASHFIRVTNFKIEHVISFLGHYSFYSF